MSPSANQSEQAKALIETAMRLLATMDDPGKIYDLIESWMKTPEIPVAFSDHLEPLNFMVGYARRDKDSFEKLFWSGIIPTMIERNMLEQAVRIKAQKRKYQRAYMRQRRLEEKHKAEQGIVPEATETPADHMAELERLLAANP